MRGNTSHVPTGRGAPESLGLEYVEQGQLPIGQRCHGDSTVVCGGRAVSLITMAVHPVQIPVQPRLSPGTIRRPSGPSESALGGAPSPAGAPAPHSGRSTYDVDGVSTAFDLARAAALTSQPRLLASSVEHWKAGEFAASVRTAREFAEAGVRQSAGQFAADPPADLESLPKSAARQPLGVAGAPKTNSEFAPRRFISGRKPQDSPLGQSHSP